MKKADIRVRLLSLIFLAALAATPASAASLIGKVIEVNEGDLVTIMSLNRPVRIKLMGVDAPDKDQPYAEIARQHLSDLVLDKLVLVEYSGLVQSRYILGKMVLGDRDIGAQMIRDGVAWYDASAASRLTAQECETYDAIEKLARSEHRGLWQDPAPTSPWAFREMLALKSKRIEVKPAAPKVETPKPTPGLTNEDLMLAVGGRSGSLSAPELSGEYDSEWKTLAPQAYSFSVRVPSTTLERGVTLPTGTGKAIDFNVALGNSGRTTYVVTWGSGPQDGKPVSGVLDDIASGFTRRMNEGIARTPAKVSFDVVRVNELKSGAMNGAEYKLTAGQYGGVLRVFTKETKNERRIFMIGAINVQDGDKRVAEFLGSLDFNRPKTESAAQKKVADEVNP